MRKLIAVAALAAAMAACGGSKEFTPDPHDFPGKHAVCKGSSVVKQRSSDNFTGEYFTGYVDCADGRTEWWDGGVRTS
ncbi:MAG TPA: hypothetical protein VGL16_09495 [Actinomycetota bacterium]